MSGDHILSVDHLTMRFGGIVAVNDLSFAAERRKVTALIGPNGAGKTTVFNCITGFYKPTGGTMRLKRHDASETALERLNDFRISKQAKVARTFQNIRLFGAMTAVENVMIGHHARMRAGVFGSIVRPSWVRREERATQERARELLAYVGLLISNVPWIVPPVMTIQQASSAPESQRFLLAGTMFLLPVILAYTAWVFHVLRGRITLEEIRRHTDRY